MSSRPVVPNTYTNRTLCLLAFIPTPWPCAAGPTDKLIRELREENERLLKMIKSGQDMDQALAANENDLKNFDMVPRINRTGTVCST